MGYYVKNESGYAKATYNREKVRAAAVRLKKARKQPTSGRTLMRNSGKHSAAVR